MGKTKSIAGSMISAIRGSQKIKILIFSKTDSDRSGASEIKSGAWLEGGEGGLWGDSGFRYFFFKNLANNSKGAPKKGPIGASACLFKSMTPRQAGGARYACIARWRM